MNKKFLASVVVGGICLSSIPVLPCVEKPSYALTIIASVTDASVYKEVIAIGENMPISLKWSTGAKQDLFYTSSDETVATVDHNGVITGIGNGTAEITISHSSNHGKDKTLTITVSEDVEISQKFKLSDLTLGTKLKKYDSVVCNENGSGLYANVINSKGSYDLVSMMNEDYILPFDAEIVGKDGIIYYLAPENLEGVTYIDGRDLSVGDVVNRNYHLLCYDYHINNYTLPVFLPKYYGQYVGEGIIKVKDIDHENKTLTLEAVVPETGDVNADGDFSIADAVILQKWLLAESDLDSAAVKAADYSGDNKLDVFDLVIMRKELLKAVKE